MDNSKIIGIANRLKVMPRNARGPLWRELELAIDEPVKPGLIQEVTNSSSIVENLRCMLSDPGIKDNGLAQAAIVKAIRAAQQQ
jgi:hypothetical protein